MSNNIKSRREVWVVVYVGAPYGIGESGHVVSRHYSQEAAESASRQLESSPRYYGNTRVRKLSS